LAKSCLANNSKLWHFRLQVVSSCKPNSAHYALAAFEQQAFEHGKEFTLITQNIDRLHQAAGSQSVIELHGSLW
jgi:NAD-dependent deacetylase sirtuin 5